MIPLRDRNPTRHTPVLTWAILGANLLAWFFLQGRGHGEELAASFCHFALIPGEFLNLLPSDRIIEVGPITRCLLDGSGTWYTPLTSMFMHGGWFHLIGNMWFLWIFGNNVEDAMNPFRFAIFYVLCGLAAGAAQVLTDPDSAVPMVGASGAIGGIMGAYARLFPKVRVDTLLILGFFITKISLPAWGILGYWFVIQILGGIPSLLIAGGGVAFWAHIGGFLAGLLLIPVFTTHRPPLPYTYGVRP